MQQFFKIKQSYTSSNLLPLHTENKYPWALLGGLTSAKGENQWMEKRPKTAWMLFQRDLRVHLASSFLRDSIPCIIRVGSF